jgi:hypothetical protein
LKDFWKEPETKKINKKRIAIAILIVVIILSIIILGVVYIKNENFREWFDTQVLRKEVNQDRLVSISIKEEENPQVYAYNQYIGVLSKNEFKIYGSTAKKEKSLQVEISNPIFASSNRYLAIAENKGKKIYCITDKDIAWEKSVEGNISQVHISKNGYVALTLVDTSYKTVIAVYDEKGEPLFNKFLSTMRVSDVAISSDNKYLAITEIDASGINIKSQIEVFSVEKARTDAQNSKVATYDFEDGELVTNIKYQDKEKLICMSKDKIVEFGLDGNKEELFNSENKKTTFLTIDLSNNIAEVEEKTADLFSADSVVTIVNTESKTTSTYTAKEVTKEIYTYENIIALNLGTEIEFINTGGWLVKRYKATQEITNITLSSSIAGIIYRDRIEIINL